MDFRIPSFEKFMQPIINEYISLDLLKGEYKDTDYIHLYLDTENGVGMSIYEHDSHANYLITNELFSVRVMSKEEKYRDLVNFTLTYKNLLKIMYRIFVKYLFKNRRSFKNKTFIMY